MTTHAQLVALTQRLAEDDADVETILRAVEKPHSFPEVFAQLDAEEHADRAHRVKSLATAVDADSEGELVFEANDPRRAVLRVTFSDEASAQTFAGLLPDHSIPGVSHPVLTFSAGGDRTVVTITVSGPRTLR